MVTERVQLPEMIIHGITKHPDRLVSIAAFESEYLPDTFPIQIPDGRILVNHAVVPIRKLIPQRIDVEDSDASRDQATEANKPDRFWNGLNSIHVEQTYTLPRMLRVNQNFLPYR